jgi:LmbE family N-acetylglucosaminyl deacetylase
MIEIKNTRVLVLAPHTDDAELGCGGTISKLLEQGNEVHCAAFSACQQSVRPDFPSDILIQEVRRASGKLGVPESNLHLFDFEVRTFNYRRQDILDTILNLKKKIDPQVVFIPSVNDVHQDHYTIAQEGLRAFKLCILFSYELPWNNLTFQSTSFSILDESHLERKVAAIREYKSQAHRPYMTDEFIRGWAHMRGVQIQERYAECFEMLRMKF